MPVVRVRPTRRRSHPSLAQVEAAAVAEAEEEEAHAAEGQLMAPAGRKLRPAGSGPGPLMVQRVRRGMPVSAGTAPRWRGRSPRRERNAPSEPPSPRHRGGQGEYA